jgi:DNA repair protein RadC
MRCTLWDSKRFPGISSLNIPVFQFPFGIPFHSLFLVGITLTDIKMQQNINEIKVSYTTKLKYQELKSITTSFDAIKMLRSFWNKDILEYKEEFYVLLLNRSNKVIGYHKISEGGSSSTQVDPKMIFSVALKCNACAVILAHNHPSGNIKPSQSDIDLTQKLKDGGKLLEVSVLDHIIVTAEDYYSFADEGKM